LHRERHLDGADELLPRERSQEQPPALLDVEGSGFERTARLLVREGRHVPDRRAPGDAVDQDGREPIKLRVHLGRFKTADLDALRPGHRSKSCIVPTVPAYPREFRTRACEDLYVPEVPFQIRPAGDHDRLPLAVLFATVAEERDGIATEPPVDVEARAANWTIDGTLVAVAGTEIVGSLHIDQSRFGFGEIGMAVAREWRGRGVGSALLAAAIEWARERSLHKLSLGVFAHNAAAIALYSKFGFVEEGRRIKHYRRANGELWDSVEMGLLL
jgi:ribosomal protein S18 acetylase RimI-like enzyme